MALVYKAASTPIDASETIRRLGVVKDSHRKKKKERKTPWYPALRMGMIGIAEPLKFL